MTAETSDAVVLYGGDRVAQARSFGSLSDEELKRRATQAARDKDFAALWGLTLAYLTADTSAGVATSPHTLRSYRKGVQLLVEYAGAQAWNLLHPGRRDPGLYVASLVAAGQKPATVQNRVAAAGALYRALRWAGATDADPFADVKRPRDRTKGIVKNPPYQPGFVEALANAAAPEERALLLLLAHGGLRIAEALELHWEHIQLDARRLLVARGKGDKARHVPLGRRLREALDAHRAECGSRATGRVFAFQSYSTAYEKLQALAASLGRGHEFRGFHAGRKHAGTQLYAQVKDFTRVATFLGHEHVDTTRRYVELPENDLQAAVEDF